jgi:hypothetical protein
MSFSLGGDGTILPPRKSGPQSLGSVESQVVNSMASKATSAQEVIRQIDGGMNPKIIAPPPEATPTVLPPDTSRAARRIAEAPAVTRDEKIRKAVAESKGVVIPLRNIRDTPKIDLTQSVTTGEIFQGDQVVLRSAGGISGAPKLAAAPEASKFPWLAVIGVAAVAYLIGKSGKSNDGEPLVADVEEEDEE